MNTRIMIAEIGHSQFICGFSRDLLFEVYSPETHEVFGEGNLLLFLFDESNMREKLRFLGRDYFSRKKNESIRLPYIIEKDDFLHRVFLISSFQYVFCSEKMIEEQYDIQSQTLCDLTYQNMKNVKNFLNFDLQKKIQNN